MEKKETIFTDGLVFRMPSEKAPDFILLSMAVKAHKFFQWCQEHQDERGWVNITIKRSQKGTIYADPEPKEEDIPIEEEPVVEEEQETSSYPGTIS